MSERMSSGELKLVGENCSQYLPEMNGITASMSISEDEGVSCATCRNWSGSRCVVDAFDNVAVFRRNSHYFRERL